MLRRFTGTPTQHGEEDQRGPLARRQTLQPITTARRFPLSVFYDRGGKLVLISPLFVVNAR
jgi:hypothetical protein